MPRTTAKQQVLDEIVNKTPAIEMPVETAEAARQRGTPAEITTTIKQFVNSDPTNRKSLPHTSIPLDKINEKMPTLSVKLVADSFSEWLYAWQGAPYTFYVRVVELPDLIANPRATITPKFLGFIPFSAMGLVANIQSLNGNKGGKFRLTVCNENGEEVSEEDFDNISVDVVIPDAFSSSGQQQQNGQLTAQDVIKLVRETVQELRGPQVDTIAEIRKQFELMQLMQTMFGRGPGGNGQSDFFSQMSDDQKRAYLAAMNPQGQSDFDLMRMELQKKSIEVWFDKLQEKGEPTEKTNFDKVGEFLQANPQVVEIGKEIAFKLLNFLQYATSQRLNNTPVVNSNPVEVNPQPVQELQQAQVQPQEPQPQQQGQTFTTAQVRSLQEQTIQETITMRDIIEDVVDAIEGEEDLTLEHPILKDLETRYGAMFGAIKSMLKNLSFDQVKEMIEGYYPDAAEVFDEPRNVERLKGLHELLKTS